MSAYAMTEGQPPGARFRFRSPLDSRGYVRLDAVFEDTELDIVLRFTYLIVKQYAWSGAEGPLTTDEIGRLLGRTPGQAYRYLQELVEAGLLSIDARPAGEPELYCLEPLERRYGEAVTGDAPGQLSISRIRAGQRARVGTRENRGAIMPVTTDERRAFEEHLAARTLTIPPPHSIDPGERERGRARARQLREQLAIAGPSDAPEPPALLREPTQS